MKSEDILLHDDDDNNLPWLKSQLRAVTDEDNKHKQPQQQDCFADCGGVLPTNLFVEEEEEEDSNDDDGDNNNTKTNDSNNNSKDNDRPSSLSTAMVAIISPGNSRTGTARINKNDNTTTDRMLWRRSSSNSLINIPTTIIDNNNRKHQNLPFTCPTSIVTSPMTTRPTITTTALVVPPTTPRGLFASFSSTQTSSEMNMWQYDATVSPRTTDAVQMMATSSAAAAAAVWTSSPSLPLSQQQQQQQENRNMSATMMIPLVPSLVHHGCSGGAVVVANATTTTRSRTANDIPSIVSFPVASSFYESFFDNDEDDVSLLADNPDEDDDNVLPIVTYDVLHNTGIFAEEEEQEDE